MKNNFLSPTVNVYLGEILNDIPVVFILESILHPENVEKRNLWNLFQSGGNRQDFSFFRIVANPQDSDFILLPHNYFILKKKLGETKMNRYVADFVGQAKGHNKKILVFAMADSDEDINIENAVIFRQSQYGYKKRDNEIIMPFYTSPAYSENFLDERERMWRDLVLRQKNVKPVVSFCGWAGFPSLYRHFTYGLHICAQDFKSRVLGDKHAQLHKRGIYFRRKAMSVLRNSKSVSVNFIIRKSYSAQKGRDGKENISPEAAEKEYVDSIINSDFVLSPKGNGNGSIRFYEALSLGRFPVLINTDCVLPLAGIINYDEFVVRVDYRDMDNLERRIVEFYNALSGEEFDRRQRLAREAFEMLRPETFLKLVLWQQKNKMIWA